jgi:methionine synthase II (cobalamin-independent)
MRELIAQWRRAASEPNPVGPAGRVARHRKDVLRQCADELEQAWHKDRHDAGFHIIQVDDCPLCETEQLDEQAAWEAMEYADEGESDEQES